MSRSTGSKKDGGDVSYRVWKTSAGWCAIAVSVRGIVRSYLPVETRSAAEARVTRELPDARRADHCCADIVEELDRFYDGKGDPRFEVRLDETGLTEFRAHVYQALRRVNWGATLTYGELAEKAGHPGAARGVGSAMASNPYPPLVPCHRVLAAGGAIGGFSSSRGIAQKVQLLRMEGAL